MFTVFICCVSFIPVKDPLSRCVAFLTHERRPAQTTSSSIPHAKRQEEAAAVVIFKFPELQLRGQLLLVAFVPCFFSRLSSGFRILFFCFLVFRFEIDDAYSKAKLRYNCTWTKIRPQRLSIIFQHQSERCFCHPKSQTAKVGQFGTNQFKHNTAEISRPEEKKRATTA